YMVAGKVSDLPGNNNGIIIGTGLAKKLNLGMDDNISITSSIGLKRSLTIVGIFEFGNRNLDESRCYVNIQTAQQLMAENSSFVNTIYANTLNPDISEEYVSALSSNMDYTIEDWKTTNSDILSQDKTRVTMMNAISISILVLAGFIIYNMLSSTISQKINDIAILKATGFSSRDVITIFITEAIIMGAIGTTIGLLVGSVLVFILSKVWMGGPVGYFPIDYEIAIYVQSFLLGLLMTFLSGYLPSRKASHVDPVEIFRK
ncbi:MAG: ABC transporter permease, partial [Flavobacteriales bacterium]|nr:ABC transporter permease [Flavobacteriales bacterium]